MKKKILLLLTCILVITACKKENAKISKSREKKIIGFEIAGSLKKADINHKTHTINITMPEEGTDKTSLTPEISISDKALIAPLSGVAQDFTNSAEYTIIAENGSTQNYTVTIELIPSATKYIESFTFKTDNNAVLKNNITGVVGETTITAAVPFWIDRERLIPTIEYKGTGISPENKKRQDFTENITYAVTAIDGTTKNYTVSVDVISNETKNITGFVFKAENNTALGKMNIEGLITYTTISATVPYNAIGTLKPTIMHTGIAISPGDEKELDFSNNINYTITAIDGTTQDYTAIINIDKNTDARITAFELEEVKNIEIDYNKGTITGVASNRANLKKITPKPLTIAEGAAIHPSKNTARDFTTPLIYVVTAPDGHTRQEYTVTIAPSASKEITKFTFKPNDNTSLDNDVEGVITGTTITATLPYGISRNRLTPTITHTGVLISPAGKLAQNFTNETPYTVTAQDGSTQKYTIKVGVEPSSDKTVTKFDLLSENNSFENIYGEIDQENKKITLTVLYGTNLDKLTPTITHTGSDISPNSGTTKSFKNPVDYIITAGNGTKEKYTVSVNTASNTETKITDFAIAGITDIKIDHTKGTITGNATIYGIVPDNTPPSTLEISVGATINPPKTETQNFNLPVKYTVTADDDTTTKEYIVTITDTNRKPTLKIFSHNNENRIGAGDITKKELFIIDNVADGDWNTTIRIGKTAKKIIPITANNNQITINGDILSTTEWNNIHDGTINITITISKGTHSKTLNTITIKEQYRIKNWQDLQGVKHNMAGHYTLANNIKCPKPGENGFPADGFEPIGSISDQFTGTFDGQSKTIKNLYINTHQQCTGLFAYLAAGGEIKNTGVEISPRGIAGGDYTGGLLGANSGTVKNSYAKGNIIGKTRVGGLAGANEGTIENSYARGSVQGTSYVGGLVGGVDYGGTINNSHAAVNTTSTGNNSYAGGLVGGHYGNINNSYATGNITISGNNSSGNAGGLTGWNSGNISNSYATGNITISSTNNHNNGGGLAGHNSGNINNCYAMGSTTANSGNTGGVAGWNSGNINNSYWNKTGIEQYASNGGGIGKSANEMKNRNTYQPQGTGNKEWNFINIWDINSNTNGGYPFLRNTKGQK